MLFAKCSIESPTFDSQSKDTLTSNINDFGSACPLSKTFIKKFIEESGIIEELINDSQAKELTKMAKTAKATKQVMVDKLEDAHMAGTSKSELCTLILTEGDSAKALAVAGLEVVGRQYYGVLPLRGKFLNVKHVPIATISSNKEVVDLAKALGLNFSKKYENGLQGAGLRYGHILIMCDQDHDGSHIKGLIINFIHEFWPALLKHEGYLQQFITPILKATVSSGTKQSQQHSFFSIAEFNEWKSNLSKAALSKVAIKYYKGLGTSTAAEGREYFRDLEKHKKLFTYSENCDEQLDLVFNKSRAKDRKEWLSTSYAPDVYIDPSIEKITFSDFINKEMIHFSHADNIRSIPSSIDGLKPSQRKVLFGCFKKNITSEIKVVQLAGYISEHSCYHHGETSLHHSIINMAQNFVGSNNVPYLLPLGQFGSRAQGGSDAASPRYIFTKLSPITRYIFPEADDDILEYLEEDGTMVEPKYYVPVVPAILINGAKGIGTGWSVSIPPYNPLDLVKYIENKLKGVTTVPDLIPWIRGFQGSVKACRDASSFDVSGVLVKVKDYNYQITELPYEEWTENYKNFLAGLQAKGLIKEFTENHSSDSVNFDIKLHKNSDIDDKELFQALKLKKKLSYQNMHCFDSQGNIKKFDNPKQIIEEFIPVRLAYYDKRKENLLKNLAINEEIARHKSNFINDVLSKKIALLGGSKDVVSENSVISQLKTLGYPTFNDIIKGDKLDGKPYGYLLDMPIHSLTVEKSSQLTQSAKEALAKLEKLKATTPKDMWLADLAALKKALNSYYSTK